VLMCVSESGLQRRNERLSSPSATRADSSWTRALESLPYDFRLFPDRHPQRRAEQEWEELL